MDIQAEHKGRGAAGVMAVAALLVVAASLIFMAWDGVRRQQELLDRHLTLTAGVVSRGVQVHLMRRLRPAMPHMGPERHDERAPRRGPREPAPPDNSFLGLGPLADEFFRETVQGSDVRWLGLVTADGRPLVAFGEQDMGGPPKIPREALAAMAAGDPWHGFVPMGERRVFLSLERAARPLSQLCSVDPALGCTPAEAETVHFALGLGAEEYLRISAEETRAAMYQTGFILLAASLFLFLASAYARRRETGQRLARLERFNSRLLDTMPDGLLTLDGEGRVDAANQSALALLGRTAEELIGRDVRDMLPEAAVSDESARTAMAGGHRLEIIARALGEPDEGRGRIVLLRDRTAESALEERLKSAEKLAAVGRMAAAVAHEVRNPLSSLRGFAQFFAKKLSGQKPDEDYAATMVREADRLNKVITDLLFLARPRAKSLSAVPVRAAAENVARLLALDAEEHGAEIIVEAEDVAVQADADGLSQVLLNLVLNALAALPEHGGTVRILAGREGPLVRLTVADDGRGMDETERERALEPFFTTRPGGTGLGLSIVQGIAESWGGCLEIESVPGAGTRAHVILNAAAEGGGNHG